jgi:hypothetical protein
METLQSIPLSHFPLEGTLHKVSDLIYYDGPLLSHFQSDQGDDYLYHWVDFDDVCNRWLVFRITPAQRMRYISRRVSLRELVTHPADGTLYALDLDNDLNALNVQLVYPADLPEIYLPQPDSIYAFQPQSVDTDLFAQSKRFGKGVMQLHFGEGEKVGYGDMNLEAYASSLVNTNQVISALKPVYKDKRVKELRDAEEAKGRDPKQIHIPLPILGDLRAIENRTGSFSLVLTANDDRNAVANEPSEMDRFIAFVITFLEDATNMDKLSEQMAELKATRGESVRSALQNFAKGLETQKLDLEIQWSNFRTKAQARHEVTLPQAEKILTNVRQVAVSGREEIIIQGRFVSFNTRNCKYEFEGEDGVRSKGVFSDDLRKREIRDVSFKRPFAVVVLRETQKSAARTKSVITDTMLAFSEIEEGIDQEPSF